MPLAAGLGWNTFDLRQDAIDAAQHRETGTPRTIEAAAACRQCAACRRYARMDDGRVTPAR